MTLDFDSFTPQRNNWFSTKIQYSGRGRAEFSQPRGWVEGKVKIHFNEIGSSSIEMKVDSYFVEDRVDTQFADNDNYLWLVNGRKPYLDAPFTFHFGGTPDNTCIKLAIQTKEGTFSIIDKANYRIGDGLDGERLIIFYAPNSIFETTSTEKAKYWVMPLTNFVTDDLSVIRYHLVGTSLYKHPLLFWNFPSFPNDFDNDDKLQLTAYLNTHTSVTPFGYNNSLAFIEPLFDYKKREKRLLGGTAKNLITAVMVGDIGDQTVGFEALKEWIPLYLLQLLSVATGSLVGTPWIEFRDSDGHLLQRIHSSQWNKSFHKGHVALKSTYKGGISRLLTIAPNKLDSHLRTAILLTIKGAQEIFDMEDSLNFFFRAFDTLTKDLRHTKRLVELRDGRDKIVRDILIHTGKQIGTVADQTEKDEKATIKNIADIVSTADQPKRHNEAEGIIEFAKYLGLNDFIIIDDISWWGKLYIRYRTQVIHESFFSKETNTHNVDEIGYLYFYLHDLLLRLLFKKLNYDGEYMSRIAHPKYIVNKSVDWVTKELTPIEIGVGRSFLK